MTDVSDNFYERVGTAVAGSDRPQGVKGGAPASSADHTEMMQQRGAVSTRRWAQADDIFWQASETCEALEPAFYRLLSLPLGPALQRTTISTDGLIHLPDTIGEKVLNEFTTFWNLREEFTRRGFLHKRGILLHGPAGGGKTSSLMLMAEQIIKVQKGIVCQIENPTMAACCLSMIRKIEPDRPIIAFMEDLDTLVQYYSESEFLSLLDGETQVDRICYVACPAPETLVLKSDLTWVRADTLNAGDELIAFDEHSIEGWGRKFRTAIVKSAPIIQKPRYRVITEIGETIVSESHPFLIKLGNRPHEWRFVEDLSPGNRLVSVGKPWQTDTSWNGGYLAGQFDGEGTLCITHNEKLNSHGFRAIWGQAVGVVTDKMIDVLNQSGYEFLLYDKNQPGTCRDGTPYKSQILLSIAGGRWGSLRFLGSVRPVRMLAHPNLKQGWEDARTSIQCYPKVLSVEAIGPGPVVALDTTTNTFIGDGYLQHNTTNYPERLDRRFVDRPSRFDTVEFIGMPSAAARRVYLAAKEPLLKNDELEEWIGRTNGFSVAHLRELIILVKCFHRTLNDSIERLEKMRFKPSSEHAPDRAKVGFDTKGLNFK